MIRLKGVALCEVVGVTNLDDNPAPETSVDMPQSAMQVAAICPSKCTDKALKYLGGLLNDYRPAVGKRYNQTCCAVGAFNASL